MKMEIRCISFYSYIKPQLLNSVGQPNVGCISFYSYIKPQQGKYLQRPRCVVYRSIPTSNRNQLPVLVIVSRLYIVLFLHQTATCQSCLHRFPSCISFYSYIKPQHNPQTGLRDSSCISFYSYIKPQPFSVKRVIKIRCISFYSYIKPQHISGFIQNVLRCISFYSYIKPQLSRQSQSYELVVYRSIPTSNRNMIAGRLESDSVVYRSIPTSNRNVYSKLLFQLVVVYRSIPTSNRNMASAIT